MTRQYISHCTSNLTDILLVDYLVVVLVCSFDRQFRADFFPTWKQYLSQFFWFHVLFLDWCLESQVTTSEFYILDFQFLFLWLSLLFFLLLYFITKFFQCCLLWPFSTNILIKNCSCSLIYFLEHIECAMWRKSFNTILMMLGSEEIKVSYDVINLYSSIPIDKATTVLIDTLNNNLNDLNTRTKLTLTDIHKLTELYLSISYFLYDH